MSNLKTKTENGVEYFFYPGLGWVTEERLSQPDVQRAEQIKDYLCNEDNILSCSDCPMNGEFKGDNILPCGQQHCWVYVHTKEEE